MMKNWENNGTEEIGLVTPTSEPHATLPEPYAALIHNCLLHYFLPKMTELQSLQHCCNTKLS